MKSLIIALVFLFFSCTQSPDMSKYLKDTRAMIKNKNYEKALERCIWFHDSALKYQPSMLWVRLSFALSDWKKLGEVYSPATDSLIAIRDRKTKQLLDNTYPSNYYSDVSAINRTLANPKKLLNFLKL